MFKLLPKRFRFPFGKVIADLLTPLIRKFNLVSPPPFALDNFRDYVWSVLFSSLTYHGVEFDPEIQCKSPLDKNIKGAILISGHFYMNYFFIRKLYDEGFDQSIIMFDIDEKYRILGTDQTIDLIKPSPKCLIDVKRRVKAGEMVSICIDNYKPIESWQKKLDIGDRSFYISDVIFKFAERFDIPVFFFGTRLNANNEIEIFTEPSSSKNTEKAIVEYSQFIDSLLRKPQN